MNDSTEVPLAGTVIRASWVTPMIVNHTELQEREEVRETTTDANGAWSLCDIPLKRGVVILWEAGDGGTAFQRDRSPSATLKAPSTSDSWRPTPC